MKLKKNYPGNSEDSFSQKKVPPANQENQSSTYNKNHSNQKKDRRFYTHLQSSNNKNPATTGKKINLSATLKKAGNGSELTKEEIISILDLRQKDQIESLFKTARVLRNRFFKNRVLLYGFLYISTFCRNDCYFCYYRKSNRSFHRYRKTEKEILEAARELAQSGVHLLDLTMGEDPKFFNGNGEGTEWLIRLIREIKSSVRLPVMVSPGMVSDVLLRKMARAGADWFACYQETHNRELFNKLRPGQDYDSRIHIKKKALEYSMKVEEGILTGVGESTQDIIKTIEAIKEMGVHQIRVMNFVPQKGTPMKNHPSPDPVRELLIIALFRLVFPDKLIPATLDVDGLHGLKKRLNAGANVITSIVPPKQGLAGVAQSSLDIDDARRTVESVLPVLTECGLKPFP